MKVFFFTDKRHDYLSESLFHGLRSLLGNSCIDTIRYDQLYSDTYKTEKNNLRGRGFSLYGLLEDNKELKSLRLKDYKTIIDPLCDIVVLNDIMKQFNIYSWLVKNNHRFIAILDGADFPTYYPYQSLKLCMQLNPKVLFSNLDKVLYFKREFYNEKLFFRNNILPKIFNLDKLEFLKKIKKISFSIPEEKITIIPPNLKFQLFNSHIVDDEVAKKTRNSNSDYIFKSESEYYQDLKNSKFGVTTKRRGWDCLRHYELAANGAVLCFKDLDNKPQNSAPHGLIKQSNCLVYKNHDDLMRQINGLTNSEYNSLLTENYLWIKQQTTKVRAKEFLVHFYDLK